MEQVFLYSIQDKFYTRNFFFEKRAKNDNNKFLNRGDIMDNMLSDIFFDAGYLFIIIGTFFALLLGVGLIFVPSTTLKLNEKINTRFINGCDGIKCRLCPGTHSSHAGYS